MGTSGIRQRSTSPLLSVACGGMVCPAYSALIRRVTMRRALGAYISERDMQQLFVRSIECDVDENFIPSLGERVASPLMDDDPDELRKPD